MNPTPTTYAKAMMDFFGRKPDQNLAGFLAELKALDAEDRAFFRAELTRIGYVLTD